MDLKRKFEENETPISLKAQKTSANSRVVMEHYNKKEDVGVERRRNSNILFLRSFNNWVKSVLIGKYKLQGRTILDIGCGKGGDLLKWSKAKISKLVGVDVAEVSIEDAKTRWESMPGPGFTAEFHVLDCFSHRISTIDSIRSIKFDAVSMQFCLHYSFETEEKARMGLMNVSSNLKLGGLFIGTVPDAYWIVKKLKSLRLHELKFGNQIYSIRFEKKNDFPLFGHKYWFNLEDAIDDCPEYLVHFPTFENMAKEYGLKLEYKYGFHDIYDKEKENPLYHDLLYRMGVIKRNMDTVMSKEEWEAARIYIGFVFKKVQEVPISKS